MKKLLFSLMVSSALLCGAEEKVLARVGIITDTHVNPSIKSCIPLEKALRIFKKSQVNMIVHCGDLAVSHKEQSYRNYRSTVKKVYPEKIPVELFAFANHDRVGMSSYEEAWKNFKQYLEVKHEPYSKTYLAGYIFLTAPQNTNWKIYEKQIADACKETPGKPVFLIDHVPALNTCYNSKAWGNASTRRVLDKYPQIVQISGHVHGTFKTDQNIWQGNFTAVNAGCTSESYSGFLVGTAPERQRAEEALLLEIYSNKLVFRRYDLAEGKEGKEYRPETPWCVPLPFDPATAPYTQEKRKQLPPEEFPAGAKLAIRPDRIPCTGIELVIPEIMSRNGAFIYSISIRRRNAAGKWEQFAWQEIFGAYNQAKEKRRPQRIHRLSSGFFETGKRYQIQVRPLNYFYTPGKELTIEFTMPQSVAYPVLFESRNPMADCRFVADRKGEKAIPVKNGFYQQRSWFARLLFPDAEKLWAGPKHARFRMTLDLHTIQPDIKYRWFLALSNIAYPHYPFQRLITPPGDSGPHRVVVEFSKPRADHVYHLFVGQGDPGQIKFNYIKIEKLP